MTLLNADHFIRTRLAKVLVAGVLACSAGTALAQYGPDYVPPPQSRYWMAYHEDRLPNYAARWGFHAGEMDGQRDLQTGHSFRPTHDDGYKHVPSSSGIPVPRDEFKNIYREAYVRGYEAGYGR